MNMSNLISRVKTVGVGALAAATIVTGVSIASSSDAEAQWRARNRGPAIAAGIIGGIAAGALIAGATRPAYGYAQPGYGYAQPSYGYAQPSYGYAAPVYAQPQYAPHSYYAPTSYDQGYGYAHAPRCFTRRVREQVDYDTVVIRRVRVCQ
jgi:hypothetical protein